MRSGIVTLTTDFGADGPYVAAMKGVILGLAPDARLVDVSHAIPPQDVRAAGFVLAEIVACFPAGTVHLAVVDPGVGTDRRMVAVSIDDQWFVLPDNGLIANVLQGRPPSGAWELRNPKHRRETVSTTFHGRDVMAPAAAFLLEGGDPADLGPAVVDLTLLPIPQVVEDGEGIIGEVISVDRFGNLITNLSFSDSGKLPRDRCLVTIPGRKGAGAPQPAEIESFPLVRAYGDRPAGTLVALVGSNGRVEIAVVNGSAADRLEVGRGTKVELRHDEGPRS